MENLSIIVLALIFFSLPVTLACSFLSTRLERIHARGYGWAQCALRYLAQGLGLPVAVAILVLACLMLLTIGGGPAWIWPFFFSGLFFYFGIGWAVAWIAVGIWFVAKNSALVVKSVERKE